MQQELYVDTPAGLSALCETLRDQPVLALDTEFLREKTYYAKLCLLQVASEDVVACIDPLALDNIDPLLDILYDPSVTKVLHSARQDLEIFFDLRGDLPRPVFDTQIAATLLGFGEQIGYANLVRQMLDVELDKMATRTDWSQRPLEQEQLHYAADDVRYLFTIYHQQADQLNAKGRMAWLAEDFDALTDVATYAMAENELWRRVKGTQRLKGAQLAVLRELAIWREQRAKASDRPRRWILKDEVLCDIARRSPGDLPGLEKIRGLEGRVIKQHGEALLKLVQKARRTPPESWPLRPEGRRLSLAQDALVDMLMAVLRLRAVENDVTPSVLASRKDLEALVSGCRDVPIQHGWRGELAGHDLQAVLGGEKILIVEQGQLVIKDPSSTQ